MTFAEALDNYIKERSSVLSPATIRKYKSMQKNKFSDIETYKLRDINQTVVQNDSVLKEVYRHTLSETREKMSNIAVNCFETMQHEKEKAP